MADNKIFQGDSTNAFGQNWLQITADFPDNTWVVAKALVKIGDLPVITFNNPVFPLNVNLTSEQTAQLKDSNNIYMAVIDSQGRKQTCEGTLTFKTKSRRV